MTCCSLNELRRDLQNVIGANFNLGPSIENFAGETFLSHEVAINIMQETKNAFKRCQVVSAAMFKCKPKINSHRAILFTLQLSNRTSLSLNAAKIFEILVEYLCEQHVTYAVMLGLQGGPLNSNAYQHLRVF